MEDLLLLGFGEDDVLGDEVVLGDVDDELVLVEELDVAAVLGLDVADARAALRRALVVEHDDGRVDVVRDELAVVLLELGDRELRVGAEEDGDGLRGVVLLARHDAELRVLHLEHARADVRHKAAVKLLLGHRELLVRDVVAAVDQHRQHRVPHLEHLRHVVQLKPVHPCCPREKKQQLRKREERRKKKALNRSTQKKRRKGVSCSACETDKVLAAPEGV